MISRPPTFLCPLIIGKLEFKPARETLLKVRYPWEKVFEDRGQLNRLPCGDQVRRSVVRRTDFDTEAP